MYINLGMNPVLTHSVLDAVTSAQVDLKHDLAVFHTNAKDTAFHMIFPPRWYSLLRSPLLVCNLILLLRLRPSTASTS